MRELAERRGLARAVHPHGEGDPGPGGERRDRGRALQLLLELAAQVLTATRERPLAEIWKASQSHDLSSSIWFTVDEDGCTRVYRRHKTESYLKPDGSTDNRNAWEGNKDPLSAITSMMERLPAGNDYVDPSLGKLDLPAYFNRW